MKHWGPVFLVSVFSPTLFLTLSVYSPVCDLMHRRPHRLELPRVLLEEDLLNSLSELAILQASG